MGRATGPAPTLLGRDTELGRVRAALAQGRSVLIVGPPGVGKTSLALAAALDTGRPVYRAAGLPFVHRSGSTVLAGALGTSIMGGDADGEAQHASAVIDDGLLVFDDLHWADPDALDLLPPLARRTPLIAVTRTGDGAEAAMTSLRETDAVRIDLDGLPEAAADELVARLRPTLAAGARADIVRRAGGNPLLLSELTRTGSPTDSLIGFVDHQLNSLDPAEIEELYLLGASAEEARPPAGVATRLAASGLVTGGEHGPVLVSGLVAERALDTLTPDRRHAVHARLAEQAPDRAAAAGHWERAGRADRATAAATEALTHDLPPAERARLLAILARSAQGDEQFDRIVSAIPMLVRTNALAEAEALLEAGRPGTGDSRRESPRWLLFEAMVQQGRGESGQALDTIDAAMSRAGDDWLVRHYLHVVRAMIHLLRFDADGARRDLDALRTGVGSDPTGRLARTLFLMGGVDLVSGGEEWRDHLARAAQGAANDGDVVLELDVAVLRTYAHYFWGERDDGHATATAAIDLADERGHVGRATYLRGTLAAHEYLAGTDPSETIDTLTVLVDDPAAAENREGQVTMLAMAMADRGRITEARQLVTRHLGDLTSANQVPWSSLHWALAQIELLDLRPGRALEHAELAVATAAGHPAGEAARVVARWCAYFLTVDQGEDAPQIACPPRTSLPALDALAVEYHAVAALTVGDLAEADRLFAQAERSTECYFCPNRWRAAWGRAETARRAGDRADSDRRFDDLPALVRATGRPGALGWVRRDPTAVVSDTRRSTDSDLTSRQMQVLSLVNRDWTSRQIGRFLDLAVSTVDDHIRAARKRLTARNRRVAARIAEAATEPGDRQGEAPLIIVSGPSGLDAARHQLEAVGWCVSDAASSDRRVGAIVSVGSEHDAEVAMAHAIDGRALALAVPDKELAAVLIDGFRHLRDVDDRRGGDPLAAIPLETLVLSRALASGTAMDEASSLAALSRRTAYRRLNDATAVLGFPAVDDAVRHIDERLATLEPPAPHPAPLV